jgi:hypothetical protein
MSTSAAVAERIGKQKSVIRKRRFIVVISIQIPDLYGECRLFCDDLDDPHNRGFLGRDAGESTEDSHVQFPCKYANNNTHVRTIDSEHAA